MVFGFENELTTFFSVHSPQQHALPFFAEHAPLQRDACVPQATPEHPPTSKKRN